MAENLYEGMFLLDSGKFASNPQGVTKKLMDILERAGATVVTHRPWQDGKLAYPVEGHRKGLHYLVYFRMPGEACDELTRLCRLSDVVLRHLVLKHPKVLFDAMVAALQAGTESAGEAEAATPAQATAQSSS